MDNTTTERKPIDPENKVLQMKLRTNPRTYMFISKIYLKKFGEVELHALGEATKHAVRIAENLQRQGFATISKINSFTHTSENGKKIKIVVSLSVTEEGKKRIDEQIKK